MMKIKVVIVEDRQDDIELLSSYLEQTRDIDIVGIAQTKDDALEMIREKRPDVIFLDIELGEEHDAGIQIARTLKQKQDPDGPKIIFTSSFPEEFGVEALICKASYFIRKPSSQQDVEKAVLEIKNELKGIERDRLIAIKRERPLRREMRFVILHTDIVFAEFYIGDVIIHTKNASYIYSNCSLGRFVKRDKRFYRMHDQYVVNIDWITQVEHLGNGRIALKLKDEERIRKQLKSTNNGEEEHIKVGGRYKDALLKRLDGWR